MACLCMFCIRMCFLPNPICSIPLCYFAIFLKRAFKGEITEKPMERPKKSSWKIVNFARECGLNGKYYLIRSYVTEYMANVWHSVGWMSTL